MKNIQVNIPTLVSNDLTNVVTTNPNYYYADTSSTFMCHTALHHYLHFQIPSFLQLENSSGSLCALLFPLLQNEYQTQLDSK